MTQPCSPGRGTSNLHLDEAGGKLYWTNNSRTLHRANLDGSSVEPVYVPDASDPDIACFRLDPVEEKLYWQLEGENAPNGIIQRADADGSNVKMVGSNLNLLTLRISE